MDFSSSSNLSSPFNDVLEYKQRRHPEAYSSDEMWELNDESVLEYVPRLEYLGFNCPAFGYEAMLISSAEVLAKGRFVTSYKAAMEDGMTVVVRRLRGVESISKFEKNMEVFGSTRQENLAQPMAYFSYEDEKLIIYEYQTQGSELYGKKLGNLVNWECRLRIAIAVAKAIALTHAQGKRKLVPGNIKASDYFLNSQNDDSFSNLGLPKMVASRFVIPTSGYRAPEVVYAHNVSQASDVYSFGVLLLELLTGRSPLNGIGVNRRHLVRWVTSMFREEGTLVVFEFVPVNNPTELIEMWKMLLVAMSCVEENPNRRPKLADVVQMMEDTKKKSILHVAT
ncbi:hypothetical protein Pfo_027871 [Paulownia fortunei]|nr:hypothetical protein Pfo_027871 [Paulownia fortunei]